MSASDKYLSAKLKILLAEDHIIIRRIILALLELKPDFKVVAEADDHEQTVNFIALYKPDVVLSDMFLLALCGADNHGLCPWVSAVGRKLLGCAINRPLLPAKIEGVDRLTSRDMEVMELPGKGMSNRGIVS